MEISFDHIRNENNIRERGLSFERAVDFDFESTIFLVDKRHYYGEVRRIAIGYPDGRLHVPCFAETPGGISASSAFARPIDEKAKNMAKRLSLINEKGEVRELTEEDFKQAESFSALPESLRAKLSTLKTRGPQKAPLKQRITIRLSQEVVDCFRATGTGWQTRMDEALKEWIQSHPPV